MFRMRPSFTLLKKRSHNLYYPKHFRLCGQYSLSLKESAPGGNAEIFAKFDKPSAFSNVWAEFDEIWIIFDTSLEQWIPNRNLRVEQILHSAFWKFQKEHRSIKLEVFCNMWCKIFELLLSNSFTKFVKTLWPMMHTYSKFFIVFNSLFRNVSLNIPRKVFSWESQHSTLWFDVNKW